MNETAWLLEHWEKIGVGVLLAISTVVFYRLWQKSEERSRSCESARLEDANKRSEMNNKLGRMEGKVETMQESIDRLQNEHLKQLIRSISGKSE